MRLLISHQTNYFYEDLALRSVQYIRMTPMALPHQTIHRWQVMLPKVGDMQTDGFGNQWLTLSRHEPHNNLQIQAFGEVEIDPNTLYIPDNPQVPYQLFAVPTKLTQCSEAMRAFAQPYLAPFLASQDADTQTKEPLAEPLNEQLDQLKQLAKALLQKMPYTKGVTRVKTTAEQAFDMGAGVCQDHTHVFLAMLRDQGIPARYVSGYIYDENQAQMASHAWAEVWLVGNWYTFDISNQHFTPNAHVYIAIGRDYADAAPVRGVRIGGGNERLNSQVMVTASKQQQQ